MSDERWRRMRALFDEVHELPPAERSSLLDRELAGDPDLRAEIDTLLRDSDQASGFLADPAAAGTVVGPYRLLELLGSGGFGVVHLAEQVRPIRRRVALKLIKPGMDTRQVIARFETERQTLALMDHPGIAQVFDAGETEQGRPYFVMEYVPGMAITAFCDEEKLPVRDRLRLFLQVCDAVQHAHQKGVIHRDLKPSNILVSRRDGTAVLKVIDFGIVKATGDAGLEGRTMTHEGTVLGTVGYMSPEQIGAIDSPVDTRADIYSLGAVLYEMLAGELPFDPVRLRQAVWTEVVRMIREEDPPPLTTRAAQSADGGVAGRRAADSRALLRELKGELEWITLRALEKEPDRRYASASELAADVRRYLANEPVLAAAPSTMYRVRKYARRHRAGVTAAALTLVAILAGGVASGIGFGRAVRAEREARQEAEASAQVADFLVELFHASSPGAEDGEALTARMLLDQGTRRIETELTGDPRVRARVLGAMSDSYLNLEAYDEGLRLTRAALAVIETARPRRDLDVAHYLDKLANAFSMAAMPDSMIPVVDRAVAILEGSGDEGAELLAMCWYRKAKWTMDRGNLAAADSLIDLALAVGESLPQPDPFRLTRIHSTKATLAAWRFDMETAARHYLRALELTEESGETMRSIALHGDLAWMYANSGEAEKALDHAQQAVDLARRIYAPDHRGLAQALGTLGYVLASQGRTREAIPFQEEGVGILRTKGTPNEELAFAVFLLAEHYRVVNRYDDAIAGAEEALEIYRGEFGPDHFRVAEVLSGLGTCYAEAGREAEAEAAFREAIGVLDRTGDTSIYPVVVRQGYADFCRDHGRLEQADSLYARVEAMLDSTNAAMRALFGDCLIGRGALRAIQGRHAEAETDLAAGCRLKRGDAAEDDATLLYPYLQWAEARVRAGNADGAVDLVRLAARCGATPEDADWFPELAALRTRPDYPLDSSP